MFSLLFQPLQMQERPREKEETMEYLDEVEPKLIKYVFVATCTSKECRSSEVGAVKNVKKSVDECPDCGHYLFWDRKPQ